MPIPLVSLCEYEEHSLMSDEGRSASVGNSAKDQVLLAAHLEMARYEREVKDVGGNGRRKSVRTFLLGFTMLVFAIIVGLFVKGCLRQPITAASAQNLERAH